MTNSNDPLDMIIGGYFRMMANTAKHIRPPKSVKIYINEETGEDAFEVVNHPNPFVPEVVRQLNTKDKFILEATDTNENTVLGSMFDFMSRMSGGDEKFFIKKVKKETPHYPQLQRSH